MKITLHPLKNWPAFIQAGLIFLLPLFFLVSGAALWHVNRAEQIITNTTLSDALQLLHSLRPQVQPGPEKTSSGQWPTEDTLGALSAELVKRAELSGLRVAQWRALPVTQTAGLKKAGVALQVQGTYSTLKGWLASSLSEQPWLVVDTLQWRLADVGSGLLDGQIGLSIYLQD
jgi:hypothetical protein